MADVNLNFDESQSDLVAGWDRMLQLSRRGAKDDGTFSVAVTAHRQTREFLVRKRDLYVVAFKNKANADFQIISSISYPVCQVNITLQAIKDALIFENYNSIEKKPTGDKYSDIHKVVLFVVISECARFKYVRDAVCEGVFAGAVINTADFYDLTHDWKHAVERLHPLGEGHPPCSYPLLTIEPRKEGVDSV